MFEKHQLNTIFKLSVYLDTNYFYGWVVLQNSPLKDSNFINIFVHLKKKNST